MRDGVTLVLLIPYSPHEILRRDKRSQLNSVKTQISVWLVEDNDQYRNNLKKLIDETEGMVCERAYPTCEEALQELDNTFAPGVFLLDIGLPRMSGIEGVSRIKSVAPGSHIIMITVYEEDEKIFKAICAGASGYLLKTSPQEKILEAIREVLSGGAPMSAPIARKVLNWFAKLNAPKHNYGLTEREKEILELIVTGFTKTRIADKLFLSFHTVDTHLRSIYNKLQVHTRTDVVAKTLKERLL